MSRKPSLNALRGYSYQETVFMLFVAKMDIDRQITHIKAEYKTGDHSFDDFVLQTKDNNMYCFQVKHSVDSQNFNIKNGQLQYNGNTLKLSTDAKNVLVMTSVSVENNTELFGIPVYQQDDIYIFNLPPIKIEEMFDSFYLDTDRVLKVIFKVKDLSYDLKIEDLPQFNLFSIDLREKTVEIEKFRVDNASGVFTVYGKPGAGKSHLVNQLDANGRDKVVYRFWISEQDESYSNRLNFQNFLSNISYQIFNDAKVRSLDEFFSDWKTKDILLVIDGLDHVENYMSCEIDNFISFIHRVEYEKTNQLLIFSCPLREYKINGCSCEISNWTEDETVKFLDIKFGIPRHICFDIYKVSKGYPIITDFIACDYLRSGTVSPTSHVDSIEAYYDNILTRDIQSLRIFGSVKCYLTIDEIAAILDTDLFNVFKEYVENRKYLFEIRGERYSLIHDSLNFYVDKKLAATPSLLLEKIEKYVMNDIYDGGVRFLSRLNLLPISKENQIKIIKTFASLKKFEETLGKTIDVEGIYDFYRNITIFIRNMDEKLFSIYEYYEYACLLNILHRIESNLPALPGLLFETLKYCKKFCPNMLNEIYSSRELYHVLQSLKKNNLNIYRGYIKYVGGEDIHKSIENSVHFFDVLDKEIDYEYLKSNAYKQLDELTPDKDKVFTEAMIVSYKNNVNFENCVDIINQYANGDRQAARERFNLIKVKYKLHKYFFRLDSIIDKLSQLGVLKNNPYRKLSLKQLIHQKGKLGSYEVWPAVEGYIRLARKENRNIDINSILYYYIMYYNRKDQSVYTIDKVLYKLLKNRKIELQQAVELIDAIQGMSEKGIRDLLCSFLNLLDKKQLHEVIKLDNFFDLPINVGWFKPETINKLPQYIFERLLYQKMGYYNHSCRVEYYEIRRIIKSKYKKLMLDIFSQCGFSIYNAPKNFKVHGNYNVKISYNEKRDKSKYNKRTPLEKGYLDGSATTWIIENSVPIIQVAQMSDGWHYKLPYSEIFEAYDKNSVRKNLKKILFNTMFLSQNKYFWDNNNSNLIGNIPKLFDMYLNKINWDKIKNILKEYLRLSNISAEI